MLATRRWLVSDIQDWQIVAAMARYGGGFVQSLAKCFNLADADNRARLKLAFPEYWRQYSEIAEKLDVKTYP
jgi:uncharacterized protein YegJ (DUF2314 family)